MNQIPNIEEIEALSEKIHHLYCAQYEKDNGEPYWTKGDYSKLDERTKEYDRNIARFIHHQLQKAREEERAFILQELALRDIPEEDGGYPLYTARQISNYLKSEWRIKSDYSELDQDVGITSEENLPEIEITAEFGQVKVITSKEQTNPIQHQPCLHSWDILLTSEPPKHKCSKCGAVRDSITSEDKE